MQPSLSKSSKEVYGYFTVAIFSLARQYIVSIALITTPSCLQISLSTVLSNAWQDSCYFTSMVSACLLKVDILKFKQPLWMNCSFYCLYNKYTTYSLSYQFLKRTSLSTKLFWFAKLNSFLDRHHPGTTSSSTSTVIGSRSIVIGSRSIAITGIIISFNRCHCVTVMLSDQYYIQGGELYLKEEPWKWV